MKVLILGINGFIGNSLSEKILSETDWELYGMDIREDKLEKCHGQRCFHFVEGDISINKEWVEYHIKKCDVVLPLVAIATPATYVKEPLRVFELDFEQNLHIVRLCAKYGKRLIFPSTSEVYGMCPDKEFDEDTSPLVTGPIRYAAVDLQRVQTVTGSGYLGVRLSERAQVHLLPPLQLDRPETG